MSQKKAESCKRQAASVKQGWFESFWGATNCRASQRLKVQAASVKPQATSIKLQATSCKLFNIFSFVKFRDARSERLYYVMKQEKKRHGVLLLTRKWLVEKPQDFTSNKK
jgi:hypothetical protein